MVEIEIGAKFTVDGVNYTVWAKHTHPNYKGWYSCLWHEKASGTARLTNFPGSKLQKILGSSRT